MLLLLSGCEDREAERPVVVDIIGPQAALAEPLRHERQLPAQVVLASTGQGLLSFNAEGDVVAALAESWIVADGGQSYIFRLRRAKWSNGDQVRAEDVAALLRQRMRANADILGGLTPEVRAMTDRVIEIRLETALPAFIQLLAQPRMAVIGNQGGTGPYVGEYRLSRLYLQPMVDEPSEENAEPLELRPRERRTLETGRAAQAVSRFQDGRTDLVLGGRFQDLLLIPHARLGATDVRADPVAGLFGLGIVGRAPFFADENVRDALSRAVDREELSRVLNLQGWTTAVTPIPAQLDLMRTPTVPAWASDGHDVRIRSAAAAVAAWRSRNGEPPVIRIALPVGAGATLLFYRLADDYRQLGLRVDRVGIDEAADLKLIDKVAAFDSALWYLSQLDCPSELRCNADASVYLDLARSAEGRFEQVLALTEAERIIVNYRGFIPFGQPIRWSLVSRRADGFAPSPRAYHPLNLLLRTTN